MFAQAYHERYQKLTKEIIAFYGFKFFYFKKVLDLGCGYADLSLALHRLGSDCTALDAREAHLKIVNKKCPTIKTVKHDLDRGWIFKKDQFDMILDLGLLCHINNYEEHLKSVCNSTTHLILETAVCDSEDLTTNTLIAENKSIYDLSANGNGSRPSTAAIERVLRECGMSFQRIDDSKFNAGTHTYNWQPKNNNDTSLNNRRIWFCVKANSPIKFAPPKAIIPKPEAKPQIIVQDIVYNQVGGNKKFVIVIPSYNNEVWCEKNITSVINQNYTNYRIIFTDDCSKDNTFEKVKNIVDNSSKVNKISLFKNNIRIGALENIYNMVHSCDDDEIILTLDGDDWLPDQNVLTKLNNYYSNEDIWITYGQYQNSTDGARGVAKQYQQNVINANSFRTAEWGASHLRTFYTWLFKKIKREDFLFKGKFMQMTWDFTMMFPMLEMAGNNSKYISDILYIYNMTNPISDHHVDRNLQHELDSYVRKMPRYSKIQKPQTSRKNVGLLLIATGKYDQFVQQMIDSADQYFLKNSNVTYYLFTDSKEKFSSIRHIDYISIEHEKFPFASLNRFKHFINNKNKLQTQDYLFYCDIDATFVDYVTEHEIFGDTVAVTHCGYVGLPGPVEDNKDSSIYIDPSKYKFYAGGGFSGGKASNYIALSNWCYNKAENELSNNRLPLHHDETIINSYFAQNEPSIVLTPSYHYPESNHAHYKTVWKNNVYKPKILLLDKNHNKIRE